MSPKRFIRKQAITLVALIMSLLPTSVSAQTPSAEDLLQNGVDAYNQMDYEQARKSFSQAIDADPKYAKAYYNRCITHSRLGDVQNALVDCEQAFGIESNYADAYYVHGLLLSERLGENHKAIQDFNRAVQIDPNFAAAYLKRGNARARLNDLDGGLQDYSQAIRIEPDYADSYYNRGVLHYNRGQKDAALQDFIQALQFHQKQENQAGAEQAGAAIDMLMSEKAKR